jgi:hypothetical protein
LRKAEFLPDSLRDRSRVLFIPTAPNDVMIARVPTVQGYNALVPRTIAELLGQEPNTAEHGSVEQTQLASPDSQVLDLLRCKLVVAGRRQPSEPLAHAIEAQAAAGDDRWTPVPLPGAGDFAVWMNRRARPVAWLVGQVRVVSPEEALRIVRGLADGVKFDPSREALVEHPIPGATVAREAKGDVTLAHYDDDEVRVITDSSTGGLLVTSEMAHPGWTAVADGRPTAVHVVNAGFRAVVVRPGRHEIVFRYQPWTAQVGFAVSGVSLLALASCLVAPRRLWGVVATNARLGRSG